ncbi:putative NADP(+)-dependent dehydrogenase [Aureobasidium sp. EXF-10727]|nr:putative NADP(+)-dependent dehydrogenase [Aureobasidium sp. EXF-10727]
MTYNVLISGANKGIGFSFVERYLNRPNTTVIATVRNPGSAEAKSLHDLPLAEGSNLIIVKIESTSDTDAQDAISSLANHQIAHLDLVIANVGLYATEAFVEVSKIRTEDLIQHFDVNTVGPLRLYQATSALLQKSEKPVFTFISTAVASISMQEYFALPMATYSASKAGMNLLTYRIHIENPWLVSFAVHPGVIETENGLKAQAATGMSKDMVTPMEVAIDGMVGMIENATREETSGKFLSFDNTPLTW